MNSLNNILILISLFALQHQANATSFDIGYDSKYVSEGRDNLSKGGIIWASGATSVSKNVSLNIAYGKAMAESVDYEELNLVVEYVNSVGNWEYYGAYNRLEFLQDNTSDNELSAGLSWNFIPLFSTFIDYVYSTEIEGSFMEIGLMSEVFINDHIIFKPYTTVAFDFGYASKNNNSHNHIGFGATINFAIDNAMSIYSTIEHTIGAQKIKEEGFDKAQTWIGVHYTLQW